MAPGLDRMAHGGGHADRIVGLGDRRVAEDCGSAELHGNDRIGRGADAGIADVRHRREEADPFQVCWIGAVHASNQHPSPTHHRPASPFTPPTTYTPHLDTTV